MTQQIEKYQLMIRVVNTKTKEVVSDCRESCMFPNSKNIVRAAARKNGCHKIGRNLIKHSYAKPIFNDSEIRLDNDADNEASSKNGHAYILINDKQVHFTYDADYDECGERNEYWGGSLAVDGSSWIEVNSVTNLKVVEVLDFDDNELPLDSYTMTGDDKLRIIEVIKDFIEGNIEASQPANSYYSA